MTLDHLIRHFGSQVAASRALGVTQPTISNWRKRGRIPHFQQLVIEHLTRGKLKASPEILARRKRTVSQV